MGEMQTAVQKVVFPDKNIEMIYTAGTMGSLTAFVPFETKEELDFFSHLEMYLRIE